MARTHDTVMVRVKAEDVLRADFRQSARQRLRVLANSTLDEPITHPNAGLLELVDLPASALDAITDAVLAASLSGYSRSTPPTTTDGA